MKFSDEYKLTEYYQVQSTIDYITKEKINYPLEATEMVFSAFWISILLLI